MKAIHMVAFLLLIVGGINWLLVGIMGKDIGVLVFGSMGHVASRVIYILVGVSAIMEVLTHKKNCKACGTSATTA